MFLFFRVLLLRISPQHLTSLWPIMVSELVSACSTFRQDWRFYKCLSFSLLFFGGVSFWYFKAGFLCAALAILDLAL